MPDLYLYWQDRDKNVARMMFHTGDISSVELFMTAVTEYGVAIGAISSAVLIRATLLYNYPETLDYPLTSFGIAQSIGLIVTSDTDGNIITYHIPAPKDAIWKTTGIMAGVVATDDVIADIIDGLNAIGSMSIYGANIVAAETTIVRAI